LESWSDGAFHNLNFQLSPALERRVQEVAVIQQYTEQALQAMHAAVGTQTSGNILATGGATVVGSWSWTPQASS
jgi:hypothetical protein